MENHVTNARKINQWPLRPGRCCGAAALALAGLCLLLQGACGGSHHPDPNVDPPHPPVQPDARDYVADLKGQLKTYGSTIAQDLASGNSETYYSTSYFIHGLAAGVQASADPDLAAALVEDCTQIIGTAQTVSTLGVSYPEFAPWDSNGRPEQLQTFQISGALARAAAVLAGNASLKARYATQINQMTAFLHQSVFTYWFDKQVGVYADPASSWSGGDVPWLPSNLGGWGSYPVWSDKASHFGMMSAWMYQATGDALYREYASRVARGFRTHLAKNGSSWIWDKGLVATDPSGNLNGSPDTSHANREPMMMAAMFDAGIEFTQADLDAMASTLLDRIWNGSDTDPRFTNYIDGGNQTFYGAGPWSDGVVFFGWNTLGRHSTEAHRIMALSYQYILKNRGLNPSLGSNNSPYGLISASGALALDEAP
jgi:hypothetical protein